MERHQDDTILLLPEDMIADIFRRLLPRSVAVARCVCKAWRALVDTRCLLRLELPHTVGSIITKLHGLTSSQFLCHPSAASTVCLLEFLEKISKAQVRNFRRTSGRAELPPNVRHTSVRDVTDFVYALRKFDRNKGRKFRLDQRNFR